MFCNENDSTSSKKIEQKLEIFQSQLDILQADMAELETKLSQAELKLAEMHSSRSWIFTIPCRFAARLLRGEWRTNWFIVKELLRRIRNKLKRYIKSWGQRSPQGLGIKADFELIGKKVLYVFPIIDWHFRIQRPQHIALELQKKGYEIVYFAVGFVVEDKPGFSISKTDHNIINISLFAPAPINIYQHGLLSKREFDFLMQGIALFEKKYKVVNRISIVDHPFWFRLANKLSGAFTIYDCMDYHPGFGDKNPSFWIQEQEALNYSDLLVLSSQDLYKRFASFNKNSILLRNACEFEFFNKKPASLASKSKPVIGYFGAIANWFNTDIVIGLAQAFPEYDFVLVGSTFGCPKLDALKECKNVSLIGEVPYKDLPQFLYNFDVCIMPFVVDELTLATSPVKVYEYLAAGKPVVATDLPEVQAMGDVVYTAKDLEEFQEKIKLAIRDNSPEKQQQRIDYSKQNDWSQRGDLLAKSIENSFKAYPKVSVIVLTYNKLEFTRRCIESVEKYSNYPNTELILVDNCSSDGTPEYFTEYAKNHSNVKVCLNEENLGFSGGNNVGIKIASGDYLILLNNDTEVTPNWIFNLLQHFKNPSTGLVGPRTNNIGNEARMKTSYENHQGMIAHSYDVYYQNIRREINISVLAFFCVVIRKEVVEKVGLLDEIFGIGMFEDDDYCFRAKALGYKLVCADDVFIHHYLSVSLKKTPKRQQLFEKNKAIFEQRHGAWLPHRPRG